MGALGRRREGPLRNTLNGDCSGMNVGGGMFEASNRSRVSDVATISSRDLFEAGLNEAASRRFGAYGRSNRAPATWQSILHLLRLSDKQEQ